MNANKLKMVLAKHLKWLRNETGGEPADLSRANLSEADLSWANLSEADLSWANLSGANLSGANLAEANLTRANLNGANLWAANLAEANLTAANLTRANLTAANLTRANLNGANLSRANLNGANLSRANLTRAIYSISVMLRCVWRNISDRMTLELMRHDAGSCKGGQKAMTAWAKGGECPFVGMERDFYFEEKKKLWKPGSPKLRGHKLWEALVKECKIKI